MRSPQTFVCVGAFCTVFFFFCRVVFFFSLVRFFLNRFERSISLHETKSCCDLHSAPRRRTALLPAAKPPPHERCVACRASCHVSPRHVPAHRVQPMPRHVKAIRNTTPFNVKSNHDTPRDVMPTSCRVMSYPTRPAKSRHAPSEIVR